MLEYRRNCECCGCELAIDDHQVHICSFECTWCAACTDTFPQGKCPNCGGNLAVRPIRPSHLQHAGVSTPERPHSDCLIRLARSA